ncbi:MAG: hypothetical protein RL662_743 [Bacteroidota bacterium]|jgi:hypothetical protein
MKIKALFAIFPFLFLILVSCDDNFNTLGGSIQPSPDGIATATDTVTVDARTISMFDSVYARTTKALLGNYNDELFGSIKSDYLCQLYFPKESKFKDNLLSIDSVQFALDFQTYLGDSLSPMGLSVYKVTSDLPEYFYTNIDPTKYADMSQVLANQTFSISGSKITSSSSQRTVTADLGVDFGTKIYDGWKNGTIKDPESFNKFFPGMYVTTNFGSGTLVNVKYTSIDIYYKYNHIKGNHDNTQDTIRSAFFSLTATPEVLQLSHLKNTNPNQLFEEGTGATYLKTPAGVFTEVVFPISEITKNMDKQSMTTVNSTRFAVKGYTEKESNAVVYGMLGRPTRLLLIDKDSVQSFFTKRQLPNNKTSFLSESRHAATNSYSFGNIAPLITEYKNRKVDKSTFLLIPVEREVVQQSTQTGQTVEVTVGIYNYMMPSVGILRSDPANMKLELVYSKF